jgi:hypothetical protein
LSSTLFSIFPFSQQHQQEHHANLPTMQQVNTTPAVATSRVEPERPEPQRVAPKKQTQEGERREEKEPKYRGNPSTTSRTEQTHGESSIAAAEAQPVGFVTPPTRPESPKTHQIEEPELSRPPEMAMMPLTPPPSTSQHRRQVPAGLPMNIMDDYVPPSPGLPVQDGEEDAGWADLRRKESNVERDDSDDEDEEGKLVDLDAVAREEMGVWGDRDDE